MSNSYTNIINRICQEFNKAFGTNYKITYDTVENINKDGKYNFKGDEGGFYNPSEQKIYMFSNIIDKIKKKNYNNSNSEIDNGLTYLVYACFHELEHRIQTECPEKLQRQIIPITKDLYKLEYAIIGASQAQKDDFYRSIHDMFFMEIDADFKGITSAKAISKIVPGTGLNFEYYNLMEEYIKYRIENYDILTIMNQFTKYAKKYPGFVGTQNYIKDKSVSLMYNNKGELKGFSELLNLSKNGVINKSLLPYAICSKLLSLESVKNLNYDEMKFVRDCIKEVQSVHLKKCEKLNTDFSDIDSTIEELSECTKVTEAPSTRKKIQMYDESAYEHLNVLKEELDKLLDSKSIPSGIGNR